MDLRVAVSRRYDHRVALPLVKIFMRTAMARCLDRIDPLLGRVSAKG